MERNDEKRNVYVQPECKVIQVDLQQMIATSGEAPNFDEGESLSW